MRLFQNSARLEGSQSCTSSQNSWLNLSNSFDGKKCLMTRIFDALRKIIMEEFYDPKPRYSMIQKRLHMELWTLIIQKDIVIPLSLKVLLNVM